LWWGAGQDAATAGAAAPTIEIHERRPVRSPSSTGSYATLSASSSTDSTGGALDLILRLPVPLLRLVRCLPSASQPSQPSTENAAGPRRRKHARAEGCQPRCSPNRRFLFGNGRRQGGGGEAQEFASSPDRRRGRAGFLASGCASEPDAAPVQVCASCLCVPLWVSLMT
jgi:hypothetical protein